MKHKDIHKSHILLKPILEKLYNNFDFKGRIKSDPILFPHKYNNPADIEISAFISSCLSYGGANLFMPVINNLLSKMGKGPANFILYFNHIKQQKLFQGIRYRFNSTQDLIAFFYILNKLAKKFGSIENIFKYHYKNTDGDIRDCIINFIDTALKTDVSAIYLTDIKPKGLLQFFPSPKNESPCKRINLFLRWMIRDKDIDFGLWKGIDKRNLIIPLDTHIARISRCIGLTGRHNPNWQMAVEITNSLKEIDKNDPLKYDFVLCHQRMSKICNKSLCHTCKFQKIG